MMIVGRWLNAFRLEETDPACLRDIDSVAPTVRSETKDCFAGVAMSASAIGGAHLWCERNLRGATCYISDVLRDEVTKAGLRLPPSFRMKLV